MSTPDAPRRLLPDHPSTEYLRKEAKRFAQTHGLKLAAAQRALAQAHGFSSWAALMREVKARSLAALSPLTGAAARADVAAVRTLLAEGADVEGAADETDSPLFAVCNSDAPAAQRIEVAQALLTAGAFTRRGCSGGATALHAAARRGPAAMVELLLHNGALLWQEDAKGKRPLDYAREGAPADLERILHLCADGPRIVDPRFRMAVAAIQSGDAGALAALLDAHPALLRERAIEPDLAQRGYFSDPKLFWFIANNPTLIDQSPANIADIARLMIARGVEQGDLDYAIELVMTNGQMPEVQQIELVSVLAGAGARPGDLLMSLGHAQRAPAAWLIDNNLLPLTAPIAAGLGRSEQLPALLAAASEEERSDALAMAVINRELEAARLCLEAGADPNRFMPCHTHSTPLHQAALVGDIPAMGLLISHGARLDIEDKLWRGRPLGWARHGKQAAAEAYLRSLMGEDKPPD